MARNNKAASFILIGAIFALVGAGLLTAGGFKSVMINPNDGPLVGDAVRTNAGHYRQLVLNYPSIFNCATLRDDLYEATAITGTTTAYPDTFYRISNEDVSDAATAYCRFKDGEQAWTFALYLPLVVVVLILAAIAFVRKSGYTLGLVGVGFASMMLSFTLVILVNYQSNSPLPQIRSHFTDCDSLDAATKNVMRGFNSAATPDTANDAAVSAYENSISGPVPRRGWVCEDTVDYDSDIYTASNLVYGGAAVSFVAYIALLIAFSYLVQPFVTPVASWSKPAAAANFRGADVDFDSEDSYEGDYYTEEEEY